MPVESDPIRVDVNGNNFLDVLPAKDISERGIGFVVPHEFKGCDINEEVRLIVSLPTSPLYTISVSAEIRHVSDQLFGAIFTNLSDSDLKVLRRFIREQLDDHPLTVLWQRLRDWLGIS